MPESLEVFVFPPSPDHVYKVGDSVTLAIQVFNFGVATDADIVMVQLNPYSSGTRWVIPTRTSVGVYEATFQIEASDIEYYSYFGGYSYLSGQVSAKIGSLTAQKGVSLRVGILIEATVTASSNSASPGNQIDLTVLVREDGILTDADALYLNASLYSFPLSSSSTSLTTARTGVGTYTAAYTVPASINESSSIQFIAEAFIGGNYTFGYASVYVPVPLGLEIWTHRVSVGDTSAVVEIYTANETGWPVSGANVTMRYQWSAFPYDNPQTDLSELSDRRGRASFDLTFQIGSFVTFWGNVTKGALRQSYSGSIYGPYVPYPQDFEIRRETTFQFNEIGVPAQLNYTVLYHNVSRAGQLVYYYAVSSEQVVANGSATTDADGRFQVSFTMPASSVSVEFSAFVDGVWRYGSDYIMGVRSLSVEHEELRIGGATHVTATLPPGPGPWGAVALFVPYDFSTPIAYGPPAWLPGSYYSGIGALVIPTGPTFTYDLLPPRFLPKNADYLFAVEVVPLNYSTTYGVYDIYLSFERVHITNAPPTPVADLSSASFVQSEALRVDMSGSVDVDGIIDAYRVDWGDGTSTGWTANASARHTYSAAGDYKVTAAVRDDTDAVAVLERTVHVEGGILGMRTTDFALFMGALVVVVVIAIALLVSRSRRRRPIIAPMPPAPIPPPTMTQPPGPAEPGLPPENPPPPPSG